MWLIGLKVQFWLHNPFHNTTVFSYHFLYYGCFCFWLHWVFVAPCRLSLLVESWGYSLVVMHKLLIVVAFLVMEHVLQGTWASVAVAQQVSCTRHVESSRTKYQTHFPCTGRQILIHCTPRKVPCYFHTSKCLFENRGKGNDWVKMTCKVILKCYLYIFQIWVWVLRIFGSWKETAQQSLQ